MRSIEPSFPATSSSGSAPRGHRAASASSRPPADGAGQAPPIAAAQRRGVCRTWRHRASRGSASCLFTGAKRKAADASLAESISGESSDKRDVPGDCVICLSKFEYPVSLVACGHTFCKCCLLDWEEMNKMSCPVCRTPSKCGLFPLHRCFSAFTRSCFGFSPRSRHGSSLRY